MRAGLRPLAGGIVLAAAMLLSGCGATRESTAVRGPVPVTSPEALWHLRAGLNVAALSCRGRHRTPVARDYRRILVRHRAVLAAAYRAERRRYGVAGLDHRQTRLYNRFANQRSPERFCRTAAHVAHLAARMDSAELARSSPRLLSELRHP